MAWQFAAIGASFKGGGDRCFLNDNLQMLGNLPALAELLSLPDALCGTNGCPLAGAAPPCSVCLLEHHSAPRTCRVHVALPSRLHCIGTYTTMMLCPACLGWSKGCIRLGECMLRPAQVLDGVSA